MGVKILGIAALIVYGAMLADVLSHGQASVNLVNGLGNVWTASVRSVAGQ
jgi:hypothetical protein